LDDFWTLLEQELSATLSTIGRWKQHGELGVRISMSGYNLGSESLNGVVDEESISHECAIETL
jgi:hypothetical protein